MKPAGPESTRKIVLLIATLGSFLTPFMGASVIVASPRPAWR